MIAPPSNNLQERENLFEVSNCFCGPCRRRSGAAHSLATVLQAQTMTRPRQFGLQWKPTIAVVLIVMLPLGASAGEVGAGFGVQRARVIAIPWMAALIWRLPPRSRP